jgi:hypothetical protein
VRDELLLAGEDPSAWTMAAALAHGLTVPAELVDATADQELDGSRARERRYADELRHGLWDVSLDVADNATVEHMNQVCAKTFLCADCVLETCDDHGCLTPTIRPPRN